LEEFRVKPSFRQLAMNDDDQDLPLIAEALSIAERFGLLEA
jgi:hypothetical protein